MRNYRHDVIVIGAGPSGSMTAYFLAKRGLRVAIIDAQRFPRDKPCGGGIQHKAALRIPFDWTKAQRGDLYGLAFSYQFGERFTRMYGEPLVHSVLRVEFDEILLHAAVAAGAELFEGVKATAVRDENTNATVDTDKGLFSARVVVGADGANSVVRQAICSRSSFYWQAGLRCEIPEDLLVKDAIDYKCMRVDWGTLPSGYAWVFPKHGFVNVGVGAPASIGRMLRPYLLRFLAEERLLKPGVMEKIRFVGHQLPTLTDRSVIAKGATLLVGDAAGLIEPFTGDGISFGIHSAEIAAEIIVRAMDRGVLDVMEYDRQIRIEIADELKWSKKLQSFFVTFPRFIHEVFRRNDKAWAAFCRVLRGEESFRVFRRKKFGRFEFLWLGIDALTERYEQRLLANPEQSRSTIMRAAEQLVGYVSRQV